MNNVAVLFKLNDLLHKTLSLSAQGIKTNTDLPK